MKKTAASLLLALLVALLLLTAVPGRSAQALRVWCLTDPVVAVNGRQLNIEIALPFDNLPNITGTVVTTVTVPEGVTVDVITVDTTYYDEVVVVNHDDDEYHGNGAVPVEVSVFVPAEVDFPVNVTLTQTATGRSATEEGSSGDDVQAEIRLRPE